MSNKIKILYSTLLLLLPFQVWSVPVPERAPVMVKPVQFVELDGVKRLMIIEGGASLMVRISDRWVNLKLFDEYRIEEGQLYKITAFVGIESSYMSVIEIEPVTEKFERVLRKTERQTLLVPGQAVSLYGEFIITN